MRLKSKPSQKKKFTANPRTKRDVLFLKKKKRDVLFKDRTDDRWVQRGAGPRAVAHAGAADLQWLSGSSSQRCGVKNE